MLKNFILTIMLSFALASCGSPAKIEPLSLSEAHKKLISTAKEDHHLDIILKPLGNTLWVYLPIDHRLLDIKASEQKTQASKQGQEALSLRFVDTTYQGRVFIIEYDIALTKNYIKDYGYTSGFDEEYQIKQRNLLSAIHRVYAQMNPPENQSGEATGEKPPEFIVMVIADIEKGIAIESTLCFDDIKRIMNPIAPLAQEEYLKRYVYELRGSPEIIGDRLGKHLRLKEIKKAEFLARQINNRITFKYTRSYFSPSEDTHKELLTIIANAVEIYQFDDYDKIGLKDLNAPEGQELVFFSKREVQSFAPEQPEGKIHVITFP